MKMPNDHVSVNLSSGKSSQHSRRGMNESVKLNFSELTCSRISSYSSPGGGGFLSNAIIGCIPPGSDMVVRLCETFAVESKVRPSQRVDLDTKVSGRRQKIITRVSSAAQLKGFLKGL